MSSLPLVSSSREDNGENIRSEFSKLVMRAIDAQNQKRMQAEADIG